MSRNSDQLNPLGKAHRVNQDLDRYGTFAEIGAGQEVARHFFQAGKASQTIAKTISAYDMVFSDEIYGREKSGRYVCEDRLNKMLEKEFNLLIKRLSSIRGDRTKFFAFASTVATGTADTPRCHGWMGVRFQSRNQGEFNDIKIHVRMRDRHRLQQQEVLGAIGVSLIYAAFYKLEKPTEFIPSLVENLKQGQAFIDIISFSGPDLKAYDNRLLNLELVKRGLAEAVLFSPQMQILNISDAVYSKSILLQRGHYSPITTTHLDVIQKGTEQLQLDLKQLKAKSLDIMAMNEMLMPANDPKVHEAEYLQRLESLSTLGLNVLVTQLPFYYQLKSFFRKFTQSQMAIVMGASHLQKLLAKDQYLDLEGGIFEGLGKLLDSHAKLYIYPHKTEKGCLTAQTFSPEPFVQHIYNHFREQKQIVDISACDDISVYHHSQDVKKLMDKKDKAWEKIVPPAVRDYMKKQKAFGFKG